MQQCDNIVCVFGRGGKEPAGAGGYHRQRYRRLCFWQGRQRACRCLQVFSSDTTVCFCGRGSKGGWRHPAGAGTGLRVFRGLWLLKAPQGGASHLLLPLVSVAWCLWRRCSLQNPASTCRHIAAVGFGSSVFLGALLAADDSRQHPAGTLPPLVSVALCLWGRCSHRCNAAFMRVGLAGVGRGAPVRSALTGAGLFRLGCCAAVNLS